MFHASSNIEEWITSQGSRKIQNLGGAIAKEPEKYWGPALICRNIEGVPAAAAPPVPTALLSPVVDVATD